MRPVFFALSLAFTTVNCTSQSATPDTSPHVATSASSTTTAEASFDTSNQGDLPARQEACELVSAEQIGAVMGCSASEINVEQMMALEDYDITVCAYYLPDGSTVQTRVSWKSEKAQENQALQKSYQSFVTTPVNHFEYEIVDGPATETLLGRRQARGYYYYHLKTRFENTVEVSVEISTTTDQEATNIQQMFDITALF